MHPPGRASRLRAKTAPATPESVHPPAHRFRLPPLLEAISPQVRTVHRNSAEARYARRNSIARTGRHDAYEARFRPARKQVREFSREQDPDAAGSRQARRRILKRKPSERPNARWPDFTPRI